MNVRCNGSNKEFWCQFESRCCKRLLCVERIDINHRSITIAVVLELSLPLHFARTHVSVIVTSRDAASEPMPAKSSQRNVPRASLDRSASPPNPLRRLP
jgi:hypothetical protein